MAGTTTSKPRTIQQNQLVPGTFVAIRGQTEYSRLLTPIDGEELEKDKARRAQNGQQPITRPYTTIQIVNARVLPRDPSGVMTNEEMYVDQRMYTRNSDGPNAPWRFTCNNKSTAQPNRFYMARPNSPKDADPFIPEHELATGLDVILVLRIFESTTFQRKGIGLHAIILQEPVRYYQGNNDKALAAAGITLHDAPVPPTPQVSSPAPGAGYSSDTAQAQQPASSYQTPQQPAPQYQAPAQPTGQYPNQQAPYQNPDQTAPYQAPAQPAGQYPPQAQPQQYQAPAQPQAPQAPQYPPQAQTQQPAPQYQAPAQPQAPQAPSEWVCPTCQNSVPLGMAFCGNCGTHRPDNVMAAQAAAMTAGAQARPGITYDANQRDY